MPEGAVQRAHLRTEKERGGGVPATTVRGLGQLGVCCDAPGMATHASDSLPNTGIASDTCGSVSATRLWNTVRESRMVTPEITDTWCGLSLSSTGCSVRHTSFRRVILKSGIRGVPSDATQSI